MSPEILRSEKYSTKSDLWSVGCILFQSLVGHAPFVVRTHYELILKLESDPVVIPPKIAQNLSPDCIDLVMRLLQKQESKRIGWEEFFRHPWWQQQASQLEMSNNINKHKPPLSFTPPQNVSMPRTNPFRDLDVSSPGTIFMAHEMQGMIDRSHNHALAVLELGDINLALSKWDAAAVLYWKGLELLDNQDPMRDVYLEKVAGLSKSHPKQSPSDLMLQFALQMGRDGGVSEILCDYEKAKQLYENGVIMLEILVKLATAQQDKGVLKDLLQKFAQRMQVVQQQQQQQQ